MLKYNQKVRVISWFYEWMEGRVIKMTRIWIADHNLWDREYTVQLYDPCHIQQREVDLMNTVLDPITEYTSTKMSQ